MSQLCGMFPCVLVDLKREGLPLRTAVLATSWFCAMFCVVFAVRMVCGFCAEGMWQFLVRCVLLFMIVEGGFLFFCWQIFIVTVEIDFTSA